jgi:glyoxylase-like metal-dependent hydrolase (beta-lactamase superfamily II)
MWSDPGAFEVAPGVHRIPLPLPGDGLKAVNVYALDDGEAVTLIDSGWLTVEAPDVLDAGLTGAGRELSNVHRILVTHIHRDHYTLAIELRRRFGARIELSVGERPSLQRIMGDEPRMRSLDRRIQRGGGGSLVDHWRSNVQSTRQGRWELPDAWIMGESTVSVGERDLDILPTPGHTRGHLVFHDRDNGLLFAGDHVLPHITPSIGFEPVPSDSPLAAYLSSLALVRERPEARLLPAHGPVTGSVHRRVDELFAHHDQRLAFSQEAVIGGAATALEVARVLRWTRREYRFEDLDLLNQMLAVNETLAHLDVLAARGLLTAESDGDTPVVLFRAADPGADGSQA